MPEGEKIRTDVPDEFRLLAACCRWPRSAAAEDAVRAGSGAVDWPLFARMARRHRVEALAWHALQRAGVAVPQDAAGALAAAADRTVRENLVSAAESLRLKRRFDEAGIPLLFVKGLTLAVLAYDTIVLKSGWDIDVLVPLERVSDAAMLLQQDGYEVAIPAGPADAGRIAGWHRRSKESVWHDRRRGTHVELHTALADHPMLIPGIGISSAHQTVEVAREIALPTLAPDELFAYLTVHGASSSWFRLKWLADVAALIGRSTPIEIDRLHCRALDLGAGRAAAVALLLCEELFGTDLGNALRSRLRRDRITRWLVRAARASMTGRAVATELDELRAGTLWIHLGQFGLQRGLAYNFVELRRQIGAQLAFA